MHATFLAVVLSLFVSASALANGRGPAVEDFVGIETEQTEFVPQGTESLFNFEKDLAAKAKAPQKPIVRAAEAPKNYTSTVLAAAFLLGLPLVSWLLVLQHLKRKASIESAGNVEVLEKYRKERELKQKDQGQRAA